MIKFRGLIFSFLFTFLGIELVSKISLESGIINDIYSEMGVTKPEHISNQGLSWRTEKDAWGAWHKPNSISIHKKSCFDVKYISNNIGARDVEDYSNKFSNESIILLGDSFMEGLGSNFEDTFHYSLQNTSNKKVFNLASAYNTGPLQYYLIYKNFSNDLPHDTVVVGFLPANDFTDNDSTSMGTRYRPYYDVKDKKNAYPILYSKNARKRYKLGRTGFNKFFASQSIRLNIVRLYKNYKLNKIITKSTQKARFYEQPKDRQDAAIFYIKKTYNLAKKNGVKRFIVLSIPDINDFKNLASFNGPRPLTRWEKKFIDFSKNNKSFIFVDGFQLTNKNENKKNYEDYFLKCNGHWTEIGASKNANLINKYLN